MKLVIQQDDIALMTIKEASCHRYMKLWKDFKYFTDVEDILDLHTGYEEEVSNFVISSQPCYLLFVICSLLCY